MTALETARGLSEAQRALLLRYDPIVDEQPITEAEFFKGDCELFVELEPEQYENGCLIDPGSKAWIASMAAQSSAGSSTWDRCSIRYTPLGLSVRALLKDNTNGNG